LRVARAVSFLRVGRRNPVILGVRYNSEKKNIIDDKFMDLLMNAGIDGADIQADEGQKTQTQDALDLTFEDVPLGETSLGEETKGSDSETESDDTESSDDEITNDQKIRKIQLLIRKSYTPKASAEVLRALEDKSNWKNLEHTIHRQLGSKLRVHGYNDAAERSGFNVNKVVRTVAQAFKNETKQRFDTDNDMSHDVGSDAGENVASDVGANEGPVLPTHLDEILGDRDANDPELEDKMRQWKELLGSSFDPDFSPRMNMDSNAAAKISKEIGKRPKVEKDALLEELYASEPEDQEDKDKKTEQKSFYEKLKEKIEVEGDNYIKEEEARPTLKKFCKPAIRKWAEDAYGALVGRGHYNSHGEWIQLNRIDQEMDKESYALATQDMTVPAYTFRVVGVPGDTTRSVKRGYIPPPCRTRIPADLVGRYRFGITAEMVENMQLSDKIKKVISFAYASHTEIKRARLEDAIKKFGKRENDTGNTAVQLCMLNQKVRHLEEHVTIHRKDQNAHRQLRLYISKRRRLYKYLKRKDLSTYYNVLKDQVLEDKFLMYKNE